MQREALLAHPLLTDLKVLVVKRRARTLPGARALYAITVSRPAPAGNGLDLGMPSNHECDSSLPRTGWDNEIAFFSMSAPNSALEAVHRPRDGGYVGEVELHPDGDRLLFTQSDRENWKIWEIRCILSGYHGVHRMGQLVVLGAGKGWYEAEGIVQRVSGRGDPVRVKVRDNLVDDDWPRFLHPYPLDARHFPVACLPDPRSPCRRWTRRAARCSSCGDGSASSPANRRGGSFYDPPSRARNTFRLAHPPWQRVFSAGFRVVCEEAQKGGKKD